MRRWRRRCVVSPSSPFLSLSSSSFSSSSSFAIACAISSNVPSSVWGQSGVQSTRHKNGGRACTFDSEARAYNVSCDHSCAFEDWSAWSACSVAFGAAFSIVYGRWTCLFLLIISFAGTDCVAFGGGWGQEAGGGSPVECASSPRLFLVPPLSSSPSPLGSESIKAEGSKLISVTGELLVRYTVEYMARTMHSALFRLAL